MTNWFKWFVPQEVDDPVDEDRKKESAAVWMAGNVCGMNGGECWENPHTAYDQNPYLAITWHAGWCEGRKLHARK